MAEIKREGASDSKRLKLSPKLGRKAIKFSYPSALVTIITSNGLKEQPFVVHKEFACHYSPVLKAAFESKLVEGRTQTYRLTDSSEDSVQLLVQWLYHQEIEVLMLETKIPDLREAKALVGLWILADKLLIPSLQNLVSDKLWSAQGKTHAAFAEVCNFVWENTKDGSPLRLLFLYRFAAYYTGQYLIDGLYPKKMLMELVVLITTNESRKRIQRTLELDPVDHYGKFHVSEGSAP